MFVLHIGMISFLLLLVYYMVTKPIYVTELSSDTSRVLSLRLCMVYALMFSSALSLLYLCVESLFQVSQRSQKNGPINVESPSFNNI